MEPLVLILLCAASLVSSIISGFFGLGGGIALLASISFLVKPLEIIPVHGVIQLSSNFTRTLLSLKKVVLKLFFAYAIALPIGVYVASLFWTDKAVVSLQLFIGLFVIALLIWRRKSPKARNFPLWIYLPLGFVTGFLTVFVGATGPLIAPFFLRDDMDKDEVIATTSACQSIGHVLKIPVFIALGFDFVGWMPYLALLIAMAIIGTYIGKLLLGRINDRIFRILFESMLFVLAVILIYKGLSNFMEW
ncbi:MAG: sulfite exporter TauE/SafE family protein [Planctomycetes bacterium]|nr:sulfite exporter TauE/SafE family protein [Planctomycetota bacterium]